MDVPSDHKKKQLKYKQMKCEKTKYYTDTELEVCFSASPK
jgi:hypothetical protein